MLRLVGPGRKKLCCNFNIKLACLLKVPIAFGYYSILATGAYKAMSTISTRRLHGGVVAWLLVYWFILK
jgi:hypothetical protein